MLANKSNDGAPFSDPCGGGELTSLGVLGPTHTHVHTDKYIHNKRKAFLKVNYLERLGLREMSPMWWSTLVIPSTGEAEAERLQH